MLGIEGKLVRPSGNGVVTASWQVSPGLCIISTAWLGVVYSGILLLSLDVFCTGFVNSRESEWVAL